MPLQLPSTCLVKFETQTPGDYFEQCSDILLTPLRVAFGRTVSISEKGIEHIERETAVALRALAALAALLLLPFTLIGVLLCQYSDTHKLNYLLVNNYKPTPATILAPTSQSSSTQRTPAVLPNNDSPPPPTTISEQKPTKEATAPSPTPVVQQETPSVPNNETPAPKPSSTATSEPATALPAATTATAATPSETAPPPAAITVPTPPPPPEPTAAELQAKREAEWAEIDRRRQEEEEFTAKQPDPSIKVLPKQPGIPLPLTMSKEEIFAIVTKHCKAEELSLVKKHLNNEPEQFANLSPKELLEQLNFIFADICSNLWNKLWVEFQNPERAKSHAGMPIQYPYGCYYQEGRDFRLYREHPHVLIMRTNWSWKSFQYHPESNLREIIPIVTRAFLLEHFKEDVLGVATISVSESDVFQGFVLYLKGILGKIPFDRYNVCSPWMCRYTGTFNSLKFGDDVPGGAFSIMCANGKEGTLQKAEKGNRTVLAMK